MAWADIPAEYVAKVPRVIDFRKIGFFFGHYLVDLQPFRLAVHGDDARMEILGERGFFHFYLHSRRERSIYVRHRIPATEARGCGYQIQGQLQAFSTLACGPNQCDFSKITSAADADFYVSLSPAERTETARGVEPFFLALAAEDIGTIVDLRQVGMDEDYLTGPKAPAGVGGVTAPEVLGKNPAHSYRRAHHRGKDGLAHEFVQVKVVDLVDNGAFQPSALAEFMAELDGVAGKRTIFHCNGGLGRAPTMLVARVLWLVWREEMGRGGRCVCDWEEQEQERLGDGRNLAHSMRRAIVDGLYARSTFIQSEEQFLALGAFAEFLANSQP